MGKGRRLGRFVGGVAFAFTVAASAFTAANVRADEGLGVSACALLASPPLDKHPVRKGPFRLAFIAASRAGLDAKKNAAAFASFEKTGERLMAESAKAFEVQHDDPEDFRAAPAQRFLARHVFTPNASLRVGRDGFELASEVAVTAMLAACLAADPEAAVAVAQRMTGAEAAQARAGAALLALFAAAGSDAEARALVAELKADDFLAAFVLAEVASRSQDRDAAWAAHTLASTLVKTADQHEALALQKKRLPERL